MLHVCSANFASFPTAKAKLGRLWNNKLSVSVQMNNPVTSHMSVGYFNPKPTGIQRRCDTNLVFQELERDGPDFRLGPDVPQPLRHRLQLRPGDLGHDGGLLLAGSRKLHGKEDEDAILIFDIHSVSLNPC